MKGGIKEWPENERPREKLQKSGADTLSDAELLALIIRTRPCFKPECDRPGPEPVTDLRRLA